MDARFAWPTHRVFVGMRLSRATSHGTTHSFRIGLKKNVLGMDY